MNKITYLLTTFALGFYIPTVSGQNPAPATEKPNIVFILADDLGYGEIGCFGQELIQTPTIDRLAVEGMKLTEHYSGSPVCASSRCTLLTGKHTGNAIIRNNRELGGWGAEEPEGQFPLRYLLHFCSVQSLTYLQEMENLLGRGFTTTAE